MFTHNYCGYAERNRGYGFCLRSSSLSDFGNRREGIVKLRIFLSKFEEYIAIFDDNLNKNRPRMRFSK